jgi:hypothetical protein
MEEEEVDEEVVESGVGLERGGGVAREEVVEKEKQMGEETAEAHTIEEEWNEEETVGQETRRC